MTGAMQRNRKNQSKKPKGKKPQRIPSVPAAFGSEKPAGNAPRIRQSNGDIVVRNEEFLALLNGTTTFTSVTYPLNPGLSTVFPWLSAIAANYEFYQFLALEVHYRPYVGTNDSGVVALACDHDVVDAAPGSLQTLMTYKGAVDGPFYQTRVLKFSAADLAKFGKQKFVRTGGYPANTDAKTYDVGNLIVGCLASTASLKGTLYLKYEVKLMVPHALTFRPAEASALFATNTASKAAPYTDAVATNANASVPVITAQDTGGFWLKAGTWLFDMLATGTTVSTTPVPGFTSTVAGSAFTELANLVNAGATTTNTTMKVTMPTDGRVSFSVPPGWGTFTNLAYRIAPYASTLV